MKQKHKIHADKHK